MGDGAEDLPPPVRCHALHVRGRRRLSGENALDTLQQPLASEIGQVGGLEADVLGARHRQAAGTLAELLLVLGEQIHEQLAPARRHEWNLGDALVGPDDDVVHVVDDVRRVLVRRAHERELVDGGAAPARRVRLFPQRDDRRVLALAADRERVGPGHDVVGDVHPVPDERLDREELLRDAVRDVHEPALARAQPERDPVLLHLEEAGPREGDVQLLLRVGGQEREVEEEPPGAPHREVALQLGEVAVAGHVLDLHRAVPAHVERGAQEDAAPAGADVTRALEDRERVGAGRDRVLEAVAGEDGAGPRRGRRRRQRQAEKPEG